MGLERITGIVTGRVRHSDSHDVITLYTRQRGRVAVLAASPGKTGRMRRAALMPASVIETDINFKAGRQLQTLGAFSRREVWHDIYFNPVKSAVAMFIAEFTNSYIRQSPPDAPMWDYVLDTLRALDGSSPRRAANIHLAFLAGFSFRAGVFPDLRDWKPGCWFDMRGGVMTPLPSHRDCLPPETAALLPSLMRITLRNAHIFRFDAAQRRLFMETALKYYAIHFPGMEQLKSPGVLSEMFHTQSSPKWQ